MVSILIINLRLRQKRSRQRNFHVSKKSVRPTITINVMERKFQGTKVPGNESSRRRKFQGTKVPAMELSFPGTKVLGYESSSYLPKYSSGVKSVSVQVLEPEPPQCCVDIVSVTAQLTVRIKDEFCLKSHLVQFILVGLVQQRHGLGSWCNSCIVTSDDVN